MDIVQVCHFYEAFFVEINEDCVLKLMEYQRFRIEFLMLTLKYMYIV